MRLLIVCNVIIIVSPALIHLPSKVDLSKNIKAINMPKSCEYPIDVDIMAISHGKVSSKLNYAQLTTKSVSVCDKMFPVIDYLDLYMCSRAKDESYRSVCKGNSGGPVVTMSDNTLMAVADFLVSGKLNR